MAITIKDIANEAGVSITTVSLVLNNKPCRISEKTKQRIFEIVEKNNYMPNLSARALVTKKTQTLGLIIPDISNPFFSELAKGVEREAQKKNYSVIFCNSNEHGYKDVSNLELLISKQIDGIIISTSLQDSETELINQFNSLIYHQHLPLVAVDRVIPNKNYDIVSLDHREGGFMATMHLLELGHRKIGCITGPVDAHSARERFRGYLDALAMYDIKQDDSLIYHGDYQIASGQAGAAKLIHAGVSAIFACNDMMACGVFSQAHRMGKVIGKDLSIIGFDDIALCEILEQPLTTIHQPVYQMGKSSCELIINMIEKKQRQKQVIKFLPSLITRQTTGKFTQ